MKLLLCPECYDIRKMEVGERVVCSCGRSSAAYREDGLYADAYGAAMVIGISNRSLYDAVDRHLDKYPEDNLTIEAWIQAEPHRHITYHREED